MSELYVFFKGKIKPNLKTFSKKDIQDMIKDMNILNENFQDVIELIEDKYENIFGIEKSHKHSKVDTFIETFENNFKKSYTDIIANLKMYQNLNVTGGNLTILNCMEARKNNPHKYLL